MPVVKYGVMRGTFFALCSSGFALMMMRELLKGLATRDFRQQFGPGLSRKLRTRDPKRRRGARVLDALKKRPQCALGDRAMLLLVSRDLSQTL